MTEQGATFRPDDAREILRRVLRSPRDKPLGHYNDAQRPREIYYCKLTDYLYSATNPLTGYTQAEARILKYIDISVSLDMEETTSSDGLITITNRSKFAYGEPGTLIIVEKIYSEYLLVWIDCPVTPSSSGIGSSVVTPSIASSGSPPPPP